MGDGGGGRGSKQALRKMDLYRLRTNLQGIFLFTDLSPGKKM